MNKHFNSMFSDNQILDKKCTGCSACYNVCPQNAIVMKENHEGFLYPEVDESKCINCGLCEKVCPELNKLVKHEAKVNCFAIKGFEDVSLKSSSGGVFYLIAKEILKNNGYICGASFNGDFTAVEHIVVSNLKDLEKLRNSKYLQSKIGDCYSIIKSLLKENKLVLFSGTPCQVAGLKTYLGALSQNEKLLTIDNVCHGVPSPMVWRKYLEEISREKEVEFVNFRHKKYTNFKCNPQNLLIEFKNKNTICNTAKKDLYYQAFSQNLISRKTCGQCNYSTLERVADITLGDFWGIEKFVKNLNPKKGLSLCIPNTDLGIYYLEKIKKQLKICKEVPVNYAISGNPNLVSPSIPHYKRKTIFENIKDTGSIIQVLKESLDEKKYDGIISNFWDAPNNYGAMLTAWALQQYFEDKNLDFRLLQFDYNKKRKKFKKSANYVFSKKYLRLTDRVSSLSDMKKLYKSVNTLVVGSDQVFRDCFLPKKLEYFLFKNSDFNKKRIAFSASFGEDKFNAGLDKNLDVYKILFDRFDGLSVREDSGVEIFKDCFDIKAEHILDPVFLIDKEKYNLFIKNKCEKYKNKIVGYLFNPKPSTINALNNFAKKNNSEFINLADSGLSTEEFLTAIKTCRYFITDSFHGTCFALIFHKNFLTLFLNNGCTALFTSLKNTFYLKDNFVENIENLEDCFQKANNVDWENIDKIIEDARNKAEEWLNKILNSPKNEMLIKNEKKYIENKNKLKIKNKFNLLKVIKTDKKFYLYILGIKLTFSRKCK